MRKNNNVAEALMKIVLSVSAAAGVLIPFWIYMVAKWAFAPEGFWQNFILFGVGVWFLGVFQLILFVLFIIFLYIIWK